MKKDYNGLKNSLTYDQTISIIEAISKKVEKRSKIDIVFCCPSHDDDKASASYSMQKKKWKCFVCADDVCGDIFDLVKLSKGLKYQADAYDCIMYIVGGVGELNKEHRSKPLIVNQITQTVSAPIEFNQKFLNFCYEASWNGPKYLIDRGFSKTLIETFKCGTHKDFYFTGERLTIPVHDENGKIIGVVGRTLGKHQDKYRYTKGLRVSEHLFNIHRAKKMGSEYVVVVEGVLDAMRLHGFGYPAVSIFGCNLSAVQADLLKKNFKKIYVCLDNDEAGEQGTKSAMELLRTMGIKAVDFDLNKFKDAGEITSKGDFVKLFATASMEMTVTKVEDVVPNFTKIDVEDVSEEEFDLSNYISILRRR